MGVAIVDLVPFLGLQVAFAPGRHLLAADVFIGVLGLAAGPVVAGLVGYLAFRYRDRLLTLIESRWRRLTALDNGAALNMNEATFAVALVVGLGAGAASGFVVVKVLDTLLP